VGGYPKKGVGGRIYSKMCGGVQNSVRCGGGPNNSIPHMDFNEEGKNQEKMGGNAPGEKRGGVVQR